MTDPNPGVGLCAECRHAVIQRNAKGHEFWRCGAAEARKDLLRYPPLPVVRCDAHRSGTPEGSR